MNDSAALPIPELLASFSQSFWNAVIAMIIAFILIIAIMWYLTRDIRAEAKRKELKERCKQVVKEPVEISCKNCKNFVPNC